MLDSFYDLPVPKQLIEVSSRHQQHIAELVLKFRKSGMDEILIEHSVDQLIASYRTELIAAIKSLEEESHA